MGYISGNITFNDYSVNCATGENKITGIANFLGNSVNSGIVVTGVFAGNSINLGCSIIQSIFSGYSINCGVASGVCFFENTQNCAPVCDAYFFGGINQSTVCGTTIFCNSCNYGYICGTGILRGNSCLFGSADYIVLCDNSIIDNSASVTTSDFLITTSVPTNIYSNDGLYYIYSCGVSTLAHGGWSNYPFSNGAITVTSMYVFVNLTNYAIPYLAQDNNLYYHSEYYSPAFLVNGPYVNGYYCSGCLDNNFYSICAINPCGYTATENQNPNQLYLIYSSGTITSACGFYPVSQTNGAFDLGYFCDGLRYNPQAINSVNYPSVGIKCIPSLNKYICFYGGILNANYPYYLLCSPNGPTSVGFFCLSESQSNACNYELINSAGLEYATQTVCFTCSLPIMALDNSLYYIFCENNPPVLASGFYSNFSIVNGSNSCCTTYFPQCAIDNCNIHYYVDGCALNPFACCKIFDDCYYYFSSDGVYTFQYKTHVTGSSVYGYPYPCANQNYCNCKIELMPFSEICRTDTCTLYENTYLAFACVYDCSALLIPYNTDANQRLFNLHGINITTPVRACSINNCYNYLVCNGLGTLANGYFTNGYYLNGEIIEPSCVGIPITVSDAVGCYYVFSAGGGTGSNCVACGPFSNGHFDNGVINATITCIDTAIDNGCLYCYCCGCACYSIFPNGYNMGIVSLVCCNITPINTIICLDGSIYNTCTDIIIGACNCYADGACGTYCTYESYGTWICYYSFNNETQQYDTPTCQSVNV